jgi:hypothetical protein
VSNYAGAIAQRGIHRTGEFDPSCAIRQQHKASEEKPEKGEPVRRGEGDRHGRRLEDA